MAQLHEAQTFDKPGDRDYPSQPAGYLLSKFGLLALLAVLLVAAWYGQVVIVVLLGLLLSAAGLAKLWSSLSLAGVHCLRSFNEQRAFPGEYIELKLRLANRKLLPLPWIQVDDEIPDQLAPVEASLRPGIKPGYRFLSNTASLLWYTAINWRYRLFCRKRGYYTLGPIRLNSGDIFGFYPRNRTQLTLDTVIVYPRIYSINQLGIPSLYPVGETKAERRIFEDPTRTIGVRDYNPHDSLKYVHWKASARHQNLQVKVFEPTTTMKVALFLAVDSFKNNRPTDYDNFELGISTAASVANYVIQQHSSVGLFANTHLADFGQPARILPGDGIPHLINILEALAKTVLAHGNSFEEFFQGEWAGLPWGTTIILIISHPSDGLPGLLASLRVAGYKTLVLQIGEEAGKGSNSTAWYHIMNPGDLNDVRYRGAG